MHQPDELEDNGHNVFYPSEKNLKLHLHDKKPPWTVKGFVTTYRQTNDYSCGALAINCFAEIMKEKSNGAILGDGIDELLKFKDTSDENIANAKSLLLSLVDKRFDCFKLFTDGGHDWNPTTVVNEDDQEKPHSEEMNVDNKMQEADETNQVGDAEVNDESKTVKRKQVNQQEHPKKKTALQASEATGVAGIMCNAGEMCLLPVDNVMLEGEGCNGSRCSKCQGPFHHVCLFVFEEELFCCKCFKQYVVSQCSTETLFKELF
jgi:hypothetical protein